MPDNTSSPEPVGTEKKRELFKIEALFRAEENRSSKKINMFFFVKLARLIYYFVRKLA